MGKTSLVNISLRALTLLGRFGLVLYLAKFVSAEAVGIYALLSATIAFSALIIGFDFYTFSSRELLQKSSVGPDKLINTHVAVLICILVVFAPISSLLFIYDVLDARHAVWFYPILLSELLAKECIRLLIAFGKAVRASLLLFCTGAAWAYLSVALILTTALEGLDVIFLSWLFFSVCTCALGYHWLKKEVDWNWSVHFVDKQVALNGLKTSIVLLVSTLCITALTTVDRHIIKAFLDFEQVGIYAMFAAVSGAVLAFIDSGVIAIYYPNVVKATNSIERISATKILVKNVILAVSALCAVVLALIHPLLWLLDNPVYEQGLPAFYVMIASVVALSISYGPHYFLYAEKQEKKIMIANVVACMVGIVAMFIFIPSEGIIGAAYALLTAYIVLSLCKITAALKIKKSYSQ